MRGRQKPKNGSLLSCCMALLSGVFCPNSVETVSARLLRSRRTPVIGFDRSVQRCCFMCEETQTQWESMSSKSRNDGISFSVKIQSSCCGAKGSPPQAAKKLEFIHTSFMSFLELVAWRRSRCERGCKKVWPSRSPFLLSTPVLCWPCSRS